MRPKEYCRGCGKSNYPIDLHKRCECCSQLFCPDCVSYLIEGVHNFLVKGVVRPSISGKRYTYNRSHALMKELNFIVQIPQEDLPLWINHRWIYNTKSEDIFQARLKGVNHA